jgi:hypothetical protein
MRYMKKSVFHVNLLSLKCSAVCSVVALCALSGSLSFAQDKIYRCGNEYTNNIKDSKNGDCKLVEGGNVTVVLAPKPQVQSAVAGTGTDSAPVRVASFSPKTSSSSSTNSGARVDNSEQRARDSDSRGILESELKKAEAKHVELLKEYNNGEPEKNALEAKSPQRYADRIAELKANIARNDSDIAGIKRELGRSSSASSKSN